MAFPNSIDTLDTVLPNVNLFVEATTDEIYYLHKEKENEMEEYNRTLGKFVGEHNTFVNVHFARINGNLVAFYYPTGNVVHWDDVNNYIESFNIPIEKSSTKNNAVTKKMITLDTVRPYIKLFVEATTNEINYLRKEFTKVNSGGSWVEYGQTEKQNVNFYFAHINGNLVAFYYPTGNVVHWDDVNLYIKSFGIPKTNTTNFFHSLPF